MQPFSSRTIETIWWEVAYADGTSISEAKGASYASINRAALSRFTLRGKQGPIAELSAENGRTGHNLVYRRRTALGEGSLRVVYVLGWVPQGPILAVDMQSEQIYSAVEFIPGDPVFYPPTPEPDKGERWTVPNPTTIADPSHERTTS